MRLDEHGVALLEVLVALVILATAAMTLIELVDTGIRAVTEARVRERELADEERFLSALSLLDRSGLDRRFGRRTIGPYVTDVQRPEQTLYRIALLRREASDIEELVTVVYRPEPPHGP